MRQLVLLAIALVVAQTLSACPDSIRPATGDAERDAFLLRLDTVKCQSGADALRDAQPPQSTQQDRPSHRPAEPLRFEPGNQSHGDAPPWIELRGDALDTQAGFTISWRTRGAVGCRAEGEHIAWQGIALDGADPWGTWTHYLGPDEPVEADLVLACWHDGSTAVASLQIRHGEVL